MSRIMRELSSYFVHTGVTPNTFNERDMRKYHAFFIENVEKFGDENICYKFGACRTQEKIYI
jgi:hypothetical protein